MSSSGSSYVAKDRDGSGGPHVRSCCRGYAPLSTHTHNDTKEDKMAVLHPSLSLSPYRSLPFSIVLL